jgi:hypothetical protein
MTQEQVEKIIRECCYVSLQSKEGHTLPTDDIKDIHVGGIDIAASEIMGMLTDMVGELEAENERLQRECTRWSDLRDTDVERLRAEIGRLRTAIRVNGLRWGYGDAEIDAVLNATRARDTNG